MTTAFTYVMGMTFLNATEAAAIQERAAGDPGAQSQQEAEVLARANAIAAKYPRLRARIEAQQSVTPSEVADQAFEYGVETILAGLEARLAARSAALAPTE